MSAARVDVRPLAAAAPGANVLRGEALGEGPPIVQLHGLTATRRHVTHGSKALPRKGFEAVLYDARGHGASDPAPAGEGYGYDALARDLLALLDERGIDRAVLAGHSMGAHTATRLALERRERVAALVVIGPASRGEEPTDRSLEYWDGLADGLEQGGVEGFVAAYDDGTHDPEWRDVILRIARQRLELHEHPDAVAQALREVPRSVPFAGLGALEELDVPVLVVASHDDADPGHPYETAREWAAHLPQATLISEERGESPLAWQGGKLSREIASFCERPEVRERLG